MTIKLLAVDMDGTLLDDHKNYDKPRFLRQFDQLATRGISFVAASGNQYATLCRYLPELVEQAAFVAENGALVIDRGREIFSAAIPRQELEPIFALIPSFPNLLNIICAAQNCYCHYRTSREGLAFLAPYYAAPIRVEEYAAIDEPILKIGFYLPPTETAAFIATATPLLGDTLRLVVSGNGFLDLVRRDVNKATGLCHLQRQWQIADHEVAAFGDNDNDLEMLRLTPFSFAPSTGGAGARQAAAFTIGSNNDNAVLDVIDDILAGVYDSRPSAGE